MTKLDKTLKDLLLERVAREEAALKQHPDVALLADYLDDLLDEPEMEAIREHLSICDACRKELRHLDEPIEGLMEFADQSAEEKARQWQELQGLMGQPPPSPIPRKPLFRQVSFAYGLAAMLLLGWVATFWRLTSPDALPNLDQAYLSPTAPGTPREATTTPEISLEAGSPGLSLTLNLSDMASFSAYALEIYADPRPERPRSRITGLARKPGGNFTVFLPRDQLEEGIFWFVLKGESGAEGKELAAYRARVKLH